MPLSAFLCLLSCRFLWFLRRPCPQKPKGRAFVNCYVLGFIALDEILRFLSSGVVHIPFEPHVRNNFLHDYAANSACLRVPFNMITALERLSQMAPESF